MLNLNSKSGIIFITEKAGLIFTSEFFDEEEEFILIETRKDGQLQKDGY